MKKISLKSSLRALTKQSEIFDKITYFFILGILFLPFLSQADATIPVTLKNPIGGTNTLSAFIDKILDVVITIATPIAVLAIIYSGFLFVKARGNDKELAVAKEVLKWTLIGVMVLLGAQLLSSVIAGTITSLK